MTNRSADNAKKTDPLVSVITPSYESPDLYATIDSVLVQTYPRIEFIIIDDGSEVFDAAAIQAYIDEHNRGNIHSVILQNDENRGTVYTMNRGLKTCTGEYIVSLAGDDQFFDRNVVEDIVSEFLRTKALVLTGKRMVFDEHMQQPLYIRPTPKERKMIRDKQPGELFEIMTKRNYIMGCCTARSRQCLERYGLLDEEYRIIDDYPDYMRLLREGVQIIFFDRFFIRYRSGGLSASKNVSDVYIKDSDLILEKEILPFTKYPKKAAERYRRWKKTKNDMADLSASISQRGSAGGNVKKLWAIMRFGFSHPRMALRGLRVSLEMLLFKVTGRCHKYISQ